jgi:hypothetical protein
VSGSIAAVVAGSEDPAGTPWVFFMGAASAGGSWRKGFGSALAVVKIWVSAFSGAGGLGSDSARVASMVFICCFLNVNAFRLFLGRAFLTIFF